jgi:glycerate kinase
LIKMRRIVVAPDKFKGTLTAYQAAEAMRDGARRVFPHASFDLCPVADGGDGTIEALITAVGGHRVDVPATDPLGRNIAAPLGLLADGRAVVELAAASGLALLQRHELDACRASSRGTGDVIREAVRRSQHVVVGVGGSASTDGGTGAARAVGWRFIDRNGRDLPEGGCSLVHLSRIDGDNIVPEVGRSTLLVASDVTNPLVGPDGAAHVYGPQKGASKSEVQLLDRALTVLAERIEGDLGIRVADVPGAGAAGGTGGGLVAFFSAEIRDGFDLIAHEGGLAAIIEAADLVLTGEGKLDRQTLAGKAPAGVARIAKEKGVRCAAIAGHVDVDAQCLSAAGISEVASMVESVGRERALSDPAGSLARTVELCLRDFSR